MSDELDPSKVLKIVQELDPILFERAMLRYVNQMQAEEIQRLTAESE